VIVLLGLLLFSRHLPLAAAKLTPLRINVALDVC